MYRKFSDEYDKIIKNVIKSLILNEGQQFTINEYRTQRLNITTILKSKLEEQLKQYHMKLLNVYLLRINFDKLINNLNLKRVLNDIYNERAKHIKTIKLTVAETNLQINNYKNKAKYEIEYANCASNNVILKNSTINYGYTLEIVRNQQFNQTLNELNFIGVNRNEVLKQRLSYIYYYTLLYHDKLNIFRNPDQKLNY